LQIILNDLQFIQLLCLRSWNKL